MIKPVFYFVIIIFCFSTQAQQNLVPNPSFEEYNTCPNYSNWYINSCKNWFMPSLGTSDYFHPCSSDTNGIGEFMFSVPQNYIGWQSAHTGAAYAGFSSTMMNDGTSYCEYISIELSEELQRDVIYKLSFYVSLAEKMVSETEPIQFINKLGALLTVTPISQINSYIIDSVPMFESNPNIWLNDTTGWQYVTGLFTVSGGEKYLTIGNYASYNELQANYLYPSPFLDKGAYYYIDDVSIEEVELTIPNVFTPNGDSVNDYFEITGISNNVHLIILDRFGIKVFDSEEIICLSGMGIAEISHVLREFIFTA